MKMLVSGAGDMKLTKDGNVLLHEMGLHPRIIAEGFEVAKIKALEVLEQVKIKKEMKREILLDVARTSLQTKVHPQLAYVLTEENGIREVFKATGCVVPGAGAVEVAIAEALVTYKHSIKGRACLGVQAFADALLIIPKVLAQNSGYDLQETLVKVQVEHSESKQPVGIDLNTGEPMVAADAGVWDNYFVKNQLLHSCTVIATNILLVDEIMRAGMSSLKG
uniref:T-complex protein 1 subunit zeta-2 n=1 Tax=Tursiops truncatus TaxID=9739 RepID=A0A2U4C6L2_TURTR|nr:T-complex protein 1 subunit zeta-2 [Tursiops truncatus]